MNMVGMDAELSNMEIASREATAIRQDLVGLGEKPSSLGANLPIIVIYDKANEKTVIRNHDEEAKDRASRVLAILEEYERLEKKTSNSEQLSEQLRPGGPR